ncbi:TPA: hypothetical protein ACKP07_005620, partial [Serratia marcescens]
FGPPTAARRVSAADPPLQNRNICYIINKLQRSVVFFRIKKLTQTDLIHINTLFFKLFSW